MNKTESGDDRADTDKECNGNNSGRTESTKQETFFPQFPVLQASECEHVGLPGNQMNGSCQVQNTVSSALHCSLPSQDVSF